MTYSLSRTCVRLLAITLLGIASTELLVPAQSMAIVSTDLAGRSLSQYPRFDYSDTFVMGSAISIALDPRYVAAGKTCDIFVVSAKSASQWATTPTLSDARGASQPAFFGTANIQNNTFALANSQSLQSGEDETYSKGYDLVLDCDRNGLLGAPDIVDGSGDATGFFVVRDSTLRGLAEDEVVSTLYSFHNFPSGDSYSSAKLYYPSTIQAMDPRPLVVISHMHEDGWSPVTFLAYEDIAKHLASWGYIVITHQNATDLGVNAAADTTLQHTWAFLALHGVISGALVGKVDASRIVFIGHSRGGEGVVLAYKKLHDGGYPNGYYDHTDISLVSAMAPTDYNGNDAIGANPGPATPYDIPFHLWLGTADTDVPNHPSIEESLSAHLFGRASGARSSTSITGAGHLAFNDFTGAQCQTSQCECVLPPDDENKIVRAYLLPIVRYYADGDIAAREFLWRQWEQMRPGNLPSPVNGCGEVQSTFRPQVGSRSVLDDYQTYPMTLFASSLASLSFTIPSLAEGLVRDTVFPASFYDHYDWGDAAQTTTHCQCSVPLTASCVEHRDCSELGDEEYCQIGASTGACTPGRPNCSVPNSACASGGVCSGCVTRTPGDPFNGSTYAGRGDKESAASLEWPNNGTTYYYQWNLTPSQRDVSIYKYLSFRMAQVANHPGVNGNGASDLDFTIRLRDGANTSRDIRLSAYGAAVRDPFKRDIGISATSSPPDYSNEFETIRVRLSDFQNNGSGLNLTNLSSISIRFGSSVGSATGRLIVDDVEFANE
jgi:hypothetical protein